MIPPIELQSVTQSIRRALREPAVAIVACICVSTLTAATIAPRISGAQAQPASGTPSVEDLEKQLDEKKRTEQTRPTTTAPAKKKIAQTEASNPEVSYLLGLTFGAQLNSAGIISGISMEDIDRGITDGVAGKKVSSSDQDRIKSWVKSAQEEMATKDEVASRQFLERNRNDFGVVTTASGLQYQVMASGDSRAASPASSDRVTVNYRGKLIDGTEFDSSYSRGESATFLVNGVIKGWQEALALMKPGAKWRLFVPPELAYGSTPRPGIPPNSLLVFDVELLSISH